MFSFHNSAFDAKTREPEDEQVCITVHIMQVICNTDPLDN